MKIAILLADGFEEIEALTPLDILRRVNLSVDLIGINGEVIVGAHGIRVYADLTAEEADANGYDMVILPGGMPGTLNLNKTDFTDEIINAVLSKNGRVAAICAAPMILGSRGLLAGRKAVCYPGFEEELIGAVISDDAVVTDGPITTARGMGVALEFAKEIVGLILGEEKKKFVSKQIME